MNNQNKRAVDSTAEKTADSIEATIRNMIENEPYKAAWIALGIGWLFGRLHRPF